MAVLSASGTLSCTSKVCSGKGLSAEAVSPLLLSVRAEGSETEESCFAEAAEHALKLSVNIKKAEISLFFIVVVLLFMLVQSG